MIQRHTGPGTEIPVKFERSSEIVRNEVLSLNIGRELEEIKLALLFNETNPHFPLHKRIEVAKAMLKDAGDREPALIQTALAIRGSIVK